MIINIIFVLNIVSYEKANERLTRSFTNESIDSCLEVDETPKAKFDKKDADMGNIPDFDAETKNDKQDGTK